MDLESFVAEAARRPPGPLYLLAGAEAYLQDRAFAALREAAAGRGGKAPLLQSFAGKEEEFAAIWEAVETRSLVSPRVLVRVLDGEAFLARFCAPPAPRKAARGEGEAAAPAARRPAAEPRLSAWLKRPGPNALVLEIPAKALKSVPAAVRDRAITVDVEIPENRELPSIIARRAEAAGLRFGAGAGTALRDLVGPNLRRIDEILDKLKLLRGTEKPVQPEEIQKVARDERESKIFDLTDAVGSGNFEGALRSYHKLKDQKQADEAILGMLNWQLKQLLAARRVLDRGGGPRDLQEDASFKAPPFRIHDFLAWARRVPRRVWEGRLDLLREADRDLKHSALPTHVLFATLLYRLCR